LVEYTNVIEKSENIQLVKSVKGVGLKVKA